MRVDLVGLLKQAAECIDPERDTGAYAYMLGEELVEHIEGVRDGRYSLQDFAKHYCLTRTEQVSA